MQAYAYNFSMWSAMCVNFCLCLTLDRLDSEHIRVDTLEQIMAASIGTHYIKHKTKNIFPTYVVWCEAVGFTLNLWGNRVGLTSGSETHNFLQTALTWY